MEEPCALEAHVFAQAPIALVASLAATVATGGFAIAQEKVLRAVLHADVRVLDPIWTTQTIANIHGMLVYDTLFGNDADMQPKPQMVDTYDITEESSSTPSRCATS